VVPASEAPLGAALAEARGQAGLSLEEVAARTRIRGSLIRAIEADDFAPCGGAVYARGHIRSIGHVVGLDPEPLIAEYDRRYGPPAEAPGAVAARYEPDAAARSEMRSRRPPNWGLAAGVALAIIIVIALVSLFGGGKSPSPVAAGSRHSPGHPSATDHPSPHPTPSSTSAPPVVADAGVNVQLRVVSEASWIDVADQDRTLFTGILQPGQTQTFHATGKLHFVIGNAGAVRFTVNGRVLGLLGGMGSVVNRTFLASTSNQA
jgi:cytoskeletal protein RodZ